MGERGEKECMSRLNNQGQGHVSGEGREREERNAQVGRRRDGRDKDRARYIMQLITPNRVRETAVTARLRESTSWRSSSDAAKSHSACGHFLEGLSR